MSEYLLSKDKPQIISTLFKSISDSEEGNIRLNLQETEPKIEEAKSLKGYRRSKKKDKELFKANNIQNNLKGNIRKAKWRYNEHLR